jgi:endonuclease/exonuclease/phosphatase family metal-dependent hydrolase
MNDIKNKLYNIVISDINKRNTLLSLIPTLDRNIKYMSYNIFDGLMKDTELKPHINKNNHMDNVIQYINDYMPDILCLQEASYLCPQIYDNTIDKLKKNGKYRGSKLKLKDYENNIYYGHQVFGSQNPNHLISLIYWNPDIFVKYSEGINLSVSNPKIDDGRPLVGIKLLNKFTGEIIIVFSMHLRHKGKVSFVKEKLEKALKMLNYNNERILLMGDFNELNSEKYNDYIDKIILNVNNKYIYLYLYGDEDIDKINTCCLNFEKKKQKRHRKHPVDLIYTNKYSTLTIKTNTGEYKSDHFPIFGELIQPISQQYEYNVYLVPFDFEDKLYKSYIQWGGLKPHSTLFKFNSIDYNKLKKSIEEINNKQNNWNINRKSPKQNYNEVQFKSNNIFIFCSQLAAKFNGTLLKQQESKDSYLHFTDTKKDDIDKCREWYYVIVRRIKRGREPRNVEWLDKYRVTV